MLSKKFKPCEVVCYLEDGTDPVFGVVAYERIALVEDKKSDKLRKNSSEKRVWSYGPDGQLGFMLEEDIIKVDCKFKKPNKTKHSGYTLAVAPSRPKISKNKIEKLLKG